MKNNLFGSMFLVVFSLSSLHADQSESIVTPVEVALDQLQEGTTANLKAKLAGLWAEAQLAAQDSKNRAITAMKNNEIAKNAAKEVQDFYRSGFTLENAQNHPYLLTGIAIGAVLTLYGVYRLIAQDSSQEDNK